MADFLLALVFAVGLVMVVEGLIYAIIPTQMKEMMLAIQTFSPFTLRVMGAAMLAVGTAIIWIVRLIGLE